MCMKSISQTTPWRGQTKKTAENNSKTNAFAHTHTHRIGMWEKHAEQSSYWWWSQCCGWIISSITLLFGDWIFSLALRDEGPHLASLGRDRFKAERIRQNDDDQGLKEGKTCAGSYRKKQARPWPHFLGFWWWWWRLLIFWCFTRHTTSGQWLRWADLKTPTNTD